MSSVFSDSRFLFIISLLSVSGMFTAAHLTNQVFPGVLIFLFVGTVLLVLGTSNDNNLFVGLVSVVLLVAGFRVASMEVPASTIGDDPQVFALWTRQVINAGDVTPIGSGFYTDAPLHVLLTSVISLVLDVDPMYGFSVFGLLIGIIAPIIAVVMARLIGVKKIRFLALIALLAGITTEAIRRSYWPIPQTTASVFWWFFLFLLLKHIRVPSKRYYGLLLLFVGVITFTHKLPLVIIGGTLVILLGLLYFDRIVFGENIQAIETTHISGIITMVFMFIFAQWVFATGLLNQIVYRVSAFIGSLLYGSSPTETSHNPTAAVPARPGILAEFYEYPVELSLYLERGHALWLLLFSGAAWITIFTITRRSEYRGTVLALLSASAICAFLISFGQVAVSAMNPTRPLLLIEPVLVVLVVGAIAICSEKTEIDSGDVGNITVSLFIIFLAATQIFAASAAADYVNTPRYYLDKPETEGGEFICGYSDNEIYVDQEQHAFSDCSVFNRISRESTDELYNAEIHPEEHGTVMYRHDVDVYLGVQSRWRLTWDPAERLPSEYHTIYDNNGVSVYHS